jgi:hypothetical protein
MPLNLGYDPARLRPTSRLIPKGRIQTPHAVRWAADGPFQQMRDPALQDLIGRQPDRIIDPLRFKIIVDARGRKGGIAAKGNACPLAPITLDDRLEHALPIVSTVNVAGTKSASLEVTELVEDEERMITGAAKVTVPNALLLITVGRTHARIHIQHDVSGWPPLVDRIDPPTREVGKR